MNRLERDRNVTTFCKTSSDSIRDCRNQFLLSWSFGIINTKDIRMGLWFRFINFFDHSSKVFNMDSGYKITTFTDYWKLLWILKPSFFEMKIKDSFTHTVEYTS